MTRRVPPLLVTSNTIFDVARRGKTFLVTPNINVAAGNTRPYLLLPSTHTWRHTTTTTATYNYVTDDITRRQQQITLHHHHCPSSILTLYNSQTTTTANDTPTTHQDTARMVKDDRMAMSRHYEGRGGNDMGRDGPLCPSLIVGMMFYNF